MKRAAHAGFVQLRLAKVWLPRAPLDDLQFVISGVLGVSLQLKKVGNSTRLILPKELLNRLELQEGDELVVSEGPHGSLTITRFTRDDDETMRIAREVMKEYHNTLRTLAK